MDFWRAIEVLNRRKWLILFSVIVAVVLMFGATRLMGARWQATIRFMVPENTSSNTTPRSTQQSKEELETLEAMYGAILSSREVVEPAFQKVREKLPDGKTFVDDIKFQAVGPRLYALHVFNPNSTRAEEIANALADSFVDRNEKLQSQEGGRLIQQLKDQMRGVDEKLAKARNEYRVYAETHKIITTPEQALLIAGKQLENLRPKRDQIRQEIAGLTARLRSTEGMIGGLLPAVKGNRPTVDGARSRALEDELDKIETRLATLQARYGSEHPDVKEARSARDTIKTQLKSAQKIEAQTSDYGDKVAQKNALDRVKSEIEARINTLQAEAVALDNSINSIESEMQQSKALGDPYGSKALEVQTLNEARINLITRLQNAEMAGDAARRSNPIVILSRVDALNPPVNVVAGRTWKLVALAGVCALLGCSGILLALDSVDRRVKTVRDADLVLPASVVAAIPQPIASLSYSELARISELQPQSLSAEAFRFLGLHLLSGKEPDTRSIMVMSAKAEQGSTTTITNLAITLAQAGRKVILVDTNTRTPELHKVFNLDNEYGFTDAVTDPSVNSLDKALLPTSVKNLHVITSGATPENRWELFRSENLEILSERLKERADFILYDTPSGILFTDALNLAPVVDAAYLCVRALETPTGEEQRMIELVGRSNVKVLGAVLSDVPIAMMAGYESYIQHYAPVAGALSAPTMVSPSALEEVENS